MKNLILFAAMVACGAIAHAEKTGNGGGAWVCREPNHSIRPFPEIIDLFEAENQIPVLAIEEYDGNAGEIVEQIKKRISLASSDFGEVLLPYFEKVGNLENNAMRKIIHQLKPLHTFDDALYDIEADPEEDCPGGTIRYEQVVNFKDDGTILVQNKIYNALSEMDKAALILHEVIYAYFRAVHEDKNSINTRKIVGKIFSTLALEELKPILEHEVGDYMRCGKLGSMTIEERIMDCKGLKNHEKSAKGVTWKLVSRTESGNEVWRDEACAALVTQDPKLKLHCIWSDRLEGPFNVGGLFNNLDLAELDLNGEFAKDNAQKAVSDPQWLRAKGYIVGIAWTLPTKEDFDQAEKDGIRQVLPNMDEWFWTSSVYPYRSTDRFCFGGKSRLLDPFAVSDRHGVMSVRFVGR